MNEKCASCASCGFPLHEPSDFASGDPLSIYCAGCVDSEGRLKSYEEVLAMNARWLEENQGLDASAARRMAVALMAELPAWKGRAQA
jgi:hypothetical protein